MLLVPILLSCSVMSKKTISIGLVTSELTPLFLASQIFSNIIGLQFEIMNLLDLPEEMRIIPTQVSLSALPWEISPEFLENSVEVILDVSNNPEYSQFLAAQAITLNLLHVVYNRPIDLSLEGSILQNTVYTANSFKTEAASLYSLIQTYGWQELAIIHNEDQNNIQISDAFQSLSSASLQVQTELLISESNSIDDLTNLLSSTFKYSNIRVGILLCSPTLASKILRAAENSALGGSGYVWILNDQASSEFEEVTKNSNVGVAADTLGVSKTGAIEIQAEDAEYLAQNPLGNLFSILGLLGQASQVLQDLSGSSLYSYLLSNPEINILPFPLHFDSSGMKSCSYLLYNIQNFIEVLVGTWEPNASVFQINTSVHVIWPGLLTDTPNKDYIPLSLVLLYTSDQTSQDIKDGFDLGIAYVNSLLSGFQLFPVYLETELSTALVNGKMRTLENLSILGYVGPETSELAVAYADYIQQASNPKPIVSYEASAYYLNSTAAFPYFLRTIPPDGLQASALAIFIQTKGWNQVGLIYTDDEVGIAIYKSFISNSASLEITAINDPDKQAINLVYNSDGSISQQTINSIDTAISELVVKQVKIIVFLGDSSISAQIAAAAYDNELYGSDFFWIGSMWLTADLLVSVQTSADYADTREKILTVLEGAMSLGFRGPQGVLGSEFSASYEKAFGNLTGNYSLFAYDTVNLYYNSILTLVAQEEDFTNGTTLIAAMRAADFTAASGTMKFTDSTNDRTSIGYSLLNVQKSLLVKVLYYDPLEGYSNQTGLPIVWGGGSASPTSDSWGASYDCPFPKVMSQSSPTGVGIVVVIGVVLFILTLGLSFYSYKQIKHEAIDIINSKVMKNWKDTLVQIQIAIEFFQFVAISPYFQSLQGVIQVISNVFMLDVLKIAQTSEQYYWQLLSAVCSLCFIWFLMMVLVIFKGDSWVRRIPVCRKIVSLLNTFFLPFFGNTMFLPVLALLLDVFVCDHQAINRPYVWRDCYMYCWQSEHYNYIALSVLAILLYEPLAVITRPLWQKAKSGVHLKVQPLFLMIKTCVQILLITVGKVLQGNSPIAHGVVFSLLILSFALLTYRFKAFNYSRCDLWEIASLVAVAYMSVLATLSNAGDSANIGWFIGLVIGWVIIVTFTLFVQRKHFPKFLWPVNEKVSKKVHSIYSLKHVGTLDRNKIEELQRGVQSEKKNENDETSKVVDISNGNHVEENGEHVYNNSSNEDSEAAPIDD